MHKPLSTLSSDTVSRDKIIEQCEQVFNATFAPDIVFNIALTRQDFYNWDSIRYVNFLFSLEKSFNIMFDYETVVSITSMTGLIDEIINRLGSK